MLTLNAGILRRQGEAAFQDELNLSSPKFIVHSTHSRISKYEWELLVRPDTHNERHRLWYYFRVRGSAKNERVLFTIPNMSKGKSSYRDGMSPLVRSLKRPTWQRLPPLGCMYYRTPPKKKGYSLSFFFEFDDPSDEFYFAYSWPFSYTDLQRALFFLEARQLPFVTRTLLTRSPQHRRVDLITITNDSQPQTPDTQQQQQHPQAAATAAVGAAGAGGGQTKKKMKKRVVVVTGRIHPGETPAQFMMQGFLDFLTSERDPRANALRNHCVFKVSLCRLKAGTRQR